MRFECTKYGSVTHWLKHVIQKSGRNDLWLFFHFLLKDDRYIIRTDVTKCKKGFTEAECE